MKIKKLSLTLLSFLFLCVDSSSLLVAKEKFIPNLLIEPLLQAFKMCEINQLNVVFDKTSIKSVEFYEKLIKFTSQSLLISLTRSEKTHTQIFLTLLVLENESFMRIVNISSQNTKEKFIILLINKTFIDDEIIFRSFLRFHTYNVNLVFEDTSGTVKINSVFPFIENDCENKKSETINYYDDKKSIWKSKEIFPNKLKNMNQCPVKLSTFESSPNVKIENNLISGYDIDLLQQISKIMNFTLQISVLDEPVAWGFIMDNGTSGGVIKKVVESEADMGIGGYYLTYSRAKFMSFCVYSSEKIVVVIPRGRPLSSLEKLFSPFDFLAWIFLLVTFFVAVLAVLIVKQMKKPVRDFVFGSNVGNAYMNMLDIFLNGSQPVEPKRNFARTLVTLFVIFCIVIRTTYQASLFQFLQSEQRLAEIKTVDELIDKGLKIHQR